MSGKEIFPTFSFIYAEFVRLRLGVKLIKGVLVLIIILIILTLIILYRFLTTPMIMNLSPEYYFPSVHNTTICNIIGGRYLSSHAFHDGFGGTAEGDETECFVTNGAICSKAGGELKTSQIFNGYDSSRYFRETVTICVDTDVPRTPPLVFN